MAVRAEVKVDRIEPPAGHGPNYFAKSTTSRTHILATADEVSGKSVATPPHIATARRCAKMSEAKRKPL
ncbi:hypothetical protein, partial [Burkholderia cenocepacia]|uniref:hypothetical protein n=1 Tax=Burkholderia cenocepacia TaxID=95486 RepID=UPI001F3CA15B